MESKLNYESIETYADLYSKVVLSSLGGDRISGLQIVELKGVKQVNLLILKNLFEKWSSESIKMRSPYFDYESDEVKQALENYMNMLSRHISIQTKDFAPLLKQAVREAILLIFSPFNYYSLEIKVAHKQNQLLKDLKLMQRYIKVNKHLLEALVTEMENLGKEEMSTDATFELFNQVCGKLKDGPEDFSTYLEKFNQVAELKTNMIYSEEEVKPDLVEEVKEVAELQSAQMYIQEIKEEKQVINERLMPPTSNREPETLFSKLAQTNSANSIKRNIGLNQRIMFTKSLFGGSQDTFNGAIDKIDETSSHKEALELIKSTYAKSGNWNFESDEVLEFMELVETKFR